MAKRRYFGSVLADKVYIGDVAVGIRLKPAEAVQLAISVLQAAQAGEPFELTAYHGKPRSDGRSQVTVTALEA